MLDAFGNNFCNSSHAHDAEFRSAELANAEFAPIFLNTPLRLNMYQQTAKSQLNLLTTVCRKQFTDYSLLLYSSPCPRTFTGNPQDTFILLLTVPEARPHVESSREWLPTSWNIILACRFT
jgi:hypothetical protein